MRPPAVGWRQDMAEPVMLGRIVLAAWWDEGRGWRWRICLRPEDVPAGAWVLSWNDSHAGDTHKGGEQ